MAVPQSAGACNYGALTCAGGEFVCEQTEPTDEACDEPTMTVMVSPMRI